MPRFLVVSFAAHGHISPSLRFAHRLASLRCHVTFLTTVFALRRIVTHKGPTHPAVTFSAFSDGHDDGFKRSRSDGDDDWFARYNLELRHRGSNALEELVTSGAEEGQPYSCLVYTLIMPWVADLAEKFEIPSVVLWVQPATIFRICYHYFHGYEDFTKRSYAERGRSSHSCLKFPDLDHLADLTVDDLPTFLDPSKPRRATLLNLFSEQFDAIDRETRPTVLVNTFDALEPEALTPLTDSPNAPRLLAIGPLISGYSNDAAITEWLDSKPKGSVIFVSFGSIEVVSRPQIDEIAKALLEFGRPFLWVIREEEDGEKVRCEDELREMGMIVAWCSQVGVLRHQAVGCFVTHCGWNSSLESLAFGIPVVAFPQANDQTTNAKLIEDVWKTGLRVKHGGGSSIVGGDEIKRCLETVLLNGDEFAVNARKWKSLAGEAVAEGGTSNQRLNEFLAELQVGDKAQESV